MNFHVIRNNHRGVKNVVPRLKCGQAAKPVGCSKPTEVIQDS